MYSYLLGSNFNVDGVDEKKEINSGINDITTEQLSYQNKYMTNNENYDFHTGVLPKHEPYYDFLNLHNSGDLFQEDDYQKRLLPPDIFKLNKLDECDLLSKTKGSYTDKQCTSRTLKRILVEDESPSTPLPYPQNIEEIAQKHSISPQIVDSPIVIKELHIKLHRCNTKQSMENKIICNDESSINCTGQSINTTTSKNIEQDIQNNYNSCKTPELPTIRKELHIKLHRCSLKQIMENKKTRVVPSINSTEQIINSTSVSKNTRNHTVTPETSKLYAIRKEIRLKSYHPSNWHHTKNYSNVYRDAIKKINVDSNGLFKSCALKEIHKYTRNKNFIKSSIDLSRTYFNIRMYALWKIYPFLEKMEEDILITSGMSISDLRSSCTSNTIFFRKLLKKCEKIANNIRVTTNSSFSRILQTSVGVNYKDRSNQTYKNKRIKFCSDQNKLLTELKYLIIDTILNLPNSIICEINRFNQNDLVNSLFSEVHGVLVYNSLIKKIRLFFNYNKNKFIDSKFDDNLNLINSLLNKIENIVGSSYIFHERVFSPNKHMVKKLSRYLLSDMYGIPAKFYEKLKLSPENIEKHLKLGNDINVKNVKQSEQSVTTREFNLKMYRKVDLCSAEFTSIIYEDAIKKIDIDSNGLFIKSVLDKLGTFIISRGITKSSLDLYVTYSNVHKYVLDKVSPYINSIITSTDLLITSLVPISELSSNCISNSIFFEKFTEKCEEIAKNINSIPDDYFSNIIQSYVYSGLNERFRIDCKKSELCSEVKSLIMDTILNLPNSTIDKLKRFKQSEIISGLFSDIHGVYIPKSLIRKLVLFCNSNKLTNDNGNFKSNLSLLSKLLAKVLSKVKSSPILHEEKLFFPSESTAELLSRYLLSDMYGIPFKFHKKFKLSISSNDLDEDCTKNASHYDYVNIEPQLLEKTILIPTADYAWNPKFITSLNIYELAISMIDIDKGDFEDSIIDKFKHYPLMKKHLRKKEKIDIDFSITYNNVKNYILEIFCPFLKEIEEGTKSKTKPVNGMTIDELRSTYISDKELFDKLRKFSTKIINRIKNCRNNTLINLIQYHVHLENLKSVAIKKNMKVKYYNDTISELLVRNISNIEDMIVSAIKSIPNSKIMEGCFSHFHDMYIDNESLLKIKLVFDSVQKKVSNDNLLNRLLDRIHLDIIDKIEKENNIYTILNGHILHGRLSTYSYIRKLVKEEFPAIKDNLSNTIMIIRNDKIEAADQKIRGEILERLRSDLIATTINSYRRLCVKKYRAYKSKMINIKPRYKVKEKACQKMP
ncbi:hypothetical protein [Candidatus Ichthyocystis sparus]|uniref:hypothetical protein n=1 Tax=Candidatus Ichthyocystis sparus TaxID=1561004 RepID=UPI000B81F322|nr:hypothetical protein [Candidatus Ichthyocystis sparus]